MVIAHTPGPWHIYPEGESFDIRPLELTPPIASVGWHEDDNNAAANTRLIAAAPDLLTALEGMECGGCHLKMTEFYNKPCPDCAPAFAAIATARGLEVPS